MTNSKYSTDLDKEDVTSLTIWRKKQESRKFIYKKKQNKTKQNKNGPSLVQFTYSNSQVTDFSQFKLIASSHFISHETKWSHQSR